MKRNIMYVITLFYTLFLSIIEKKQVYADFDGVNIPRPTLEFFNTFALHESELAAGIYNVLYPIGIVFGLYGIIMAGYTYMTSEGRPDKVKDANERLTQAVLGILFIMLSLVILRLIISTLFGADI